MLGLVVTVRSVELDMAAFLSGPDVLDRNGDKRLGQQHASGLAELLLQNLSTKLPYDGYMYMQEIGFLLIRYLILMFLNSSLIGGCEGLNKLTETDFLWLNDLCTCDDSPKSRTQTFVHCWGNLLSSFSGGSPYTAAGNITSRLTAAR